MADVAAKEAPHPPAPVNPDTAIRVDRIPYSQPSVHSEPDSVPPYNSSRDQLPYNNRPYSDPSPLAPHPLKPTDFAKAVSPLGKDDLPNRNSLPHPPANIPRSASRTTEIPPNSHQAESTYTPPMPTDTPADIQDRAPDLPEHHLDQSPPVDPHPHSSSAEPPRVPATHPYPSQNPSRQSLRQSDGRHSSPQHINDLDQISGPPVEQLGPDHASFENAQPSDQLFNVVSSFGDMNLAPQMHFPTSLQMLPMQHPAVIPISPAHVAHQRHPHQVLHQTPATYYLWVPQERVGAVIGGHGAVIRNLQDRSGATIQVHNETIRDEHKLFTIFGTYAQYEAAANLITDIVERPRPSARGGPSVSSDKSQYPNLHDHTPRATEMYKTVYVPTTCVGLVIGRNGETIRSLQDKSGADIKVTPDEDAQPGSEHRSITISGTEEAIATAHQLVSEIVNDAKSLRPPHMGIPAGSSPNGEPVITEVLPVPNDKVGLIIGKRGTTIRDLQMRSGAKIQVTKDDTCVQSDGSRPVTITGIRSNVDEAKTLIATKINIPLPPSSPVPTAFSATTPGGTPVLPHATPTQPHPYMFSQAFDPEFLQSNQQSFQPGFEMSENPVSNRGGVAYYPYFGYNSYAAIAQQRHFQQAVQMHYGHGQQPLQDPQVSQQPHPEQQEFHLPPAFEAAGMPQSHSVDGSGGPSGMVPRSGSGNIVMYPTHPFQQVSHHMPSPQHYPPNPNQRIYPPRDPSQIAHANMHSQMYSQGQQGRVHTNAQILQAQGQTHAQIDAKGQPQLHAQIHAEGHVEAHPSSPPQERTHHEPEQPKG